MKRAAIAAVGVSTALLALAYGLAFVPDLNAAVPAGLLALGTGGVLSATLALGAARDGRLGVIWIPVVFVFLLVAVGMAALLVLPPTDPSAPDLVLGLPPRAAFLLYGIGLLPTLVVPVTYALTFERQTLRPGDLERIRAAAVARDAEASEEEAP